MRIAVPAITIAILGHIYRRASTEYIKYSFTERVVVAFGPCKLVNIYSVAHWQRCLPTLGCSVTLCHVTSSTLQLN